VDPSKSSTGSGGASSPPGCRRAHSPASAIALDAVRGRSREEAVKRGSRRAIYDHPQMRRVVYYCAASLDGYIAEADDTIEWLTAYEGQPLGSGVEPVEGGYASFYKGVGALVSGSVTYEFILGELERGTKWPYKGKPCWILSSRDLPAPAGEDVRIVDAAVSGLYDEMIASAGELDLWVVGGGNVASQFADLGLLDEVLVTIVPVVLGDGKPLFDRRLPGGPMRLTGVLPRASGMVELRYEIKR
jgi:dihydrofolate reductase